MLTSDPIVASAEALDAAKTYLRVEHDDDDVAIASFVVAAIMQCEAFIGEAVLERSFVERIEGGTGWCGLSARPVAAITTVADEGGAVLPVGSYQVDIDTDGVGKVRLTTGAKRLKVTYRAGRAASWAGIAEPVRLGIVRQAAHHYGGRDRTGDAGPPAAVTGLWRGARRVRLT